MAIVIKSDKYYKDLAALIRKTLGVTTTYTPAEISVIIKGDLKTTLDAKYAEVNNYKAGVLYTETGVKFIGTKIYAGSCAGLDVDHVYIPDDITEIGAAAFIGSTITDISLPESLESIDERVFSNCEKLEAITFPESLLSIGDYAFYGCYALKDISFPNGLSTISNYAFYDCINIASITIPESVTSLGEHAFHYCQSLAFADLPSSIKAFPGNLFSNAEALETLILRTSDRICTTSLPQYSINNTKIANGEGYIYVPSSLVASYQADACWTETGAQFRAIEDYPDICGTT